MKQAAAKKIVLGLMVLVVLAWVADFIVWRIESARGRGMATVAVDQYLATSLKGNKAEYDFLGTVQQPCAKALFPHAGAEPCWWLAQHRSQWQ